MTTEVKTKRRKVTRAEYRAGGYCGSTAFSRALKKKLGHEVLVTDYEYHIPKDGRWDYAMVTYQDRKAHKKVTFKSGQMERI